MQDAYVVGGEERQAAWCREGYTRGRVMSDVYGGEALGCGTSDIKV